MKNPFFTMHYEISPKRLEKALVKADKKEAIKMLKLYKKNFKLYEKLKVR